MRYNLQQANGLGAPFKGRSGIPPCDRPLKFIQNIKPFYLSRIEELELIIHGSESHEHVLQLNVNIYVIGIDFNFNFNVEVGGGRLYQ
jgi:hypothetical protein